MTAELNGPHPAAASWHSLFGAWLKPPQVILHQCGYLGLRVEEASNPGPDREAGEQVSQPETVHGGETGGSGDSSRVRRVANFNSPDLYEKTQDYFLKHEGAHALVGSGSTGFTIGDQ